MRTLTTAIFTLISAAATSASGQSGVSVDDVIESLVAARGAIESGEFTAGCRYVCTDASGEARVQMSRVHCVFHFPSGSMHFRRYGDIHISLNSSANLTDEYVARLKAGQVDPGPRIRQFDATFVRNEDYLADWACYGRFGDADSARSHLEIREPHTDSAKVGLRSFDPMIAGLCLVTELEGGFSLTEVVERLMGRALMKKLSIRSDGLIDVVLTSSRDVRTFVIDPDGGWTCVGMKAAELDEAGNEEPLPQASGGARWIEVAGNRVPVSFQTRVTARNGRQYSWEYSLEWSRVNNVPKTDPAFQYESVEGLWPNVTVYERRGGQRTPLAVVGEDSVMRVIPRLDRSADQTDQSGPERFRAWFLYFNVAAAFLAIVMILFMQRRK